MRVSGHRMRDHLRLLRPLFLFIGAVWLMRLVLTAAGAPLWLSRLVSVTMAGAIAMLLAVVRIHFHGFGGYSSVVVASLLLTVWEQFLIVASIVFSVLTGTVNVYTLPEFSVEGDDPLHLRHIAGHLTFMTGLGTLLGAAMGCLMLWVVRMIVPAGKARLKPEK